MAQIGKLEKFVRKMLEYLFLVFIARAMLCSAVCGHVSQVVLLGLCSLFLFTLVDKYPLLTYFTLFESRLILAANLHHIIS